MTQSNSRSTSLLASVQETQATSDALIDQLQRTQATFASLQRWFDGMQAGVQHYVGGLVVQSAADASGVADKDVQLQQVARAIATVRKVAAKQPQPIRGRKRRRYAITI